MSDNPMSPQVTKQNIDFDMNQLIAAALANREAVQGANEALVVATGSRTGRSPNDRFIVEQDETAKEIFWGDVNRPVSQKIFNNLWQKAEAFIQEREHYISHLQVGADSEYAIPVTAITEYAWHNLFVQHLFIKPQNEAKSSEQAWTLLSVPSLKTKPEEDKTRSDGVVMINFKERRVLLCGMRYAGEMKKSMFSVLNFLLPAKDVLPMHCAANQNEEGDVCLFFGLSGTGKTTLSADEKRALIGDDEHGWSGEGVFNFEGGCYAKCIDLSREREPVIWDAIRYGTILENVVLDTQTNQPLYEDATLTQNTRAAYPREHIPRHVKENKGGHPSAVIFLTCDLFGVLPPVALLDEHQAAYHFLSGYTALVGSTEMGQGQGIKTTFSRCFGAPFFPRAPKVYADLLIKRLRETGAQVYLVNTGWCGGGYGVGERFSIQTTRAVIHAIQSGALKKSPTEVLPGFKLRIPTEITGVDANILRPSNTWSSQDDYQAQLNELIAQFRKNFKQFDVSDDIKAAGPEAL